MAAGALQAYFMGKVDISFQRLQEVWGSMPELYLLIIFSALFQPSIGLLPFSFQCLVDGIGMFGRSFSVAVI